MKKRIIVAVGFILLANILTGCLDNDHEEIEQLFPNADFSYSPLYPSIDQEITFDASPAGDIDGLITRYQWDFGDNSTSEGELVTHLYDNEGRYSITLTVTDDDNLVNSTTKEITVTKKTKGTFYFSSKKISLTIPAPGEDAFQVKPIQSDTHSFTLENPLDAKPGDWSALLWIKSPLSLLKAYLVAKDKQGNEIDTLDFKIKMLRFNKERQIEAAENFNGGEVKSIDLYFIGWAPSAWLLNTTMVSFLYGEGYPSSITFY
jgi:PKD repeat protein